MINSKALKYGIQHHAKGVEELVNTLALGILLDLEPRGWELKQVRFGAESFYIINKNYSKEYHFRSWYRPRKSIQIKDAYRKGKLVLTLNTRLDALNFIEKCVKES